MSFNKFDNHARKEISTHETPLDTEALWGKVQADLYPKRKKKFAWIWFSASSFFFAILLAGYFHTHKNASNVDLVSMPTVKEETQSKRATTDIQNHAKNKSTKTETTATSGSTKKGSAENRIVNKPTKGINKKKTGKTFNSFDQQKSTPLFKSTELIQKSIQSKNNIVTAHEEIQNSRPKSNLINIPTEQKTNSSLTPAILQKNDEETKEVKKENFPTPENSNKVNENKEDKEKIIAISKENIEANEEGTISSSNEDEKNNPLEELKDEEENDDEISLKKKYRIGIGFRTGISNSTTTLSANGDSNMQLAALRNLSESNLETIDLGIEVLLKHKSGFYVSTGIDYLRAARKLTYNNEVVDTDSIQGISAIFVNPITMDSTFQEGLIEETTTTTRRKETFNNLHIINIPLHLGISLNYEQWIFGVQGGASINVFLNQKGEIQDSESTFYDLGEDSNNWFKNNIGVSYQGSAFVGYTFSNHFQLVAGPSFRSPMVISEDSNPVRQSFVNLGLQVSARYWW